jgi:hypothetical protein
LRPVQDSEAPPPGLLPDHWAELQASGIAADVAALNIASFGPGTERHWEAERAELVRFERLRIQTASTTGRGHPQTQAGHLSEALAALDRRYRHLQAGGWRTVPDALPGLEPFSQWKPNAPRPRRDKPGRLIKYEAPPGFTDGGGLLLPRVPERCWRLICERHRLPFPSPEVVAAGFWPWALTTPGLPLLICEGWKKSLAAISAGWAAVAVPGVTMGRRVDVDGSERLIEALQLLAAPDRPWLIAFDAEAMPDTAAKVGAAAGALARVLRRAGGRPEIARLPLLPGAEKTGLDDLLAAAGPEALDRALADTGPRPVLPRLRAADRVAPAGAWLGDACPIPSPEDAPLVVLQAPMGCGKTEAIAAALQPLAAVGVPVLMPSHRKALGQAAAEQVGVPWCPSPGSDARLQGVAGCLDSWCPDSALQISHSGWDGGVMVLDELMQALEHLLTASGTALAHRRAVVLRTLAEQLPRMRQVIASDAQLADWGVNLLEALTGRRALLIRSDHRPMAGRPLHCPEGLQTSGRNGTAAQAFRAKWAQLVAAGQPFLCWTTAQKARSKNAPQTLAKLHRKRVPGAQVLVIDSTTPEAAAALAADPDGEAARWDAIYCSPSISSGISFRHWKPAAVIALAGGRIAPEHAAQALARVRSPEVPAYLFAPERAPGSALRVGSGATNPADLIRHLRGTTDPLLGQLEQSGSDGAWLQAWAELGAHRNRQRFAYRATIAGLLVREGWELQAPGPEPCTLAAAQAAAELQTIADEAQAAEDAAVIAAPLLEHSAAAALNRRRQRTPQEQAALDRFQLDQTWALGAAAPSQQLLEADRDGLADRLRLGWILTTPEALALIPEHDRQRIAALDPAGRPFAPDRLRVALAPRVAALQLLGTDDRPRVLLELLQRFAGGQVIAATDPAIEALHQAATDPRNRAALTTATGYSPAAKPTGTLRALLGAIGWQLERAGRIKARGDDRDALTYTAQPVALPEGVDPQALAAAWLEQLRSPAAGALSPPIRIQCMGEKCPSDPPPKPSPPPRPWPLARSLAIPWRSRPPAPPGFAPVAAAAAC